MGPGCADAAWSPNHPAVPDVIGVLIIAEIRLYREGIALILSRQRRIAPVATAADVSDGLDAYRRLSPDVVLLDGAMADSIGAVRGLLAVEPDTRVVVLGVEEREREMIAYAEAGVSGYVTRNADTAVLCETIEAVARGETPCSPTVAATLFKRIAALAAQSSTTRSASRLTIREREVVELVRDGLSNKEIAERLCIEVATVKNHVHNILEKLDVRRRADVAGALGV